MSTLLSIITFTAQTLSPLAGHAATAAAIVFVIVMIRLMLHPLSRAAVRGERQRAELAPDLERLRKKYSHDRKRLTEEVAKLHREAGASPVAGCLPMLLQLPVFVMLYQLFASAEIAGQPNPLLSHTLFGAKLGGNLWQSVMTGAVLSPAGLVYVGLVAIVAAAATSMYRRARRNTVSGGPALLKYMPLLSYGTIVALLVVPLAAGLYLATTTAWTAGEQAWLRRRFEQRRR